MRVWVDLTNTAHPVVLRPLVEVLERRGDEVLITARPLRHTLELLDDWGHAYTALGAYGGARRADKARAARSRRAAHGRVGQGARAVRRGARARLDRPADREPAAADPEHDDVRLRVGDGAAQPQLPPRQPRARPGRDPAERLRRYGATKRKLVQYPGLKEEYVLHGFEADPEVPEALGLDLDEPIAVIRTAPSYALYLGGKEAALLPRLIRHLHDQGAQVVVLARNDEQRAEAAAPGSTA